MAKAIAYTEQRQALRTIFGECVDQMPEQEIIDFCDFILDVAKGIKGTINDQALNNVMNDFRYVEKDGRFCKRMLIYAQYARTYSIFTKATKDLNPLFLG